MIDRIRKFNNFIARNKFEKAKRYTGDPRYWGISGEKQLDFLKRNGCVVDSDVLEIGCGSLNAAIPIIIFLDPSHYVGIEPNQSLISGTIRALSLEDLFRIKKPEFLYNEDFDASGLNRRFDFILSHSVLSHAAHWQLGEFLRQTKNILKPNGKIIASIRLAQKDSGHTTWQYPENSFFSIDTVKKISSLLGLAVEVRPDYKKYFIEAVPPDIHDWLIFMLK